MAWRVVFLLLTYLATAAPVDAQTVATKGACSPAVQGVTGDVSISINCHLGDPKAPKFRISYYRVGGVGLSFLLDGLLSPEWAKTLGGQQAIVQNAVAKEARKFLDRFAKPVGGSSLYGKVSFEGGDYTGSFADYAKSVDPDVKIMRGDAGTWAELDPERWRAYFGNGRGHELFIPDMAAADTLFRTADWPPQYNVLYGDAIGSGGPLKLKNDVLRPAPLLWRWLTPADLEGYEKRYKAYIGRITQKVYPELGAAFHIERGKRDLIEWQRDELFDVLESIRYLTREGMPERFLLVEGVSGVHSGWLFASMPRDFRLLVAVVENVGKRPIEMGDFAVREVKAMTVREHDASNAALDRARSSPRRVYPPGVLKPGEKIVLPMRIELPQSSPLYDVGEQLARAGAKGARMHRAIKGRGGAKIGIANHTDSPLFRKPAASFPPHRAPEIVERFEYGPAWRIDNVIVDGARFPFRAHDPNNFVLIAGVGVGSCPFAFTYQPESKLWFSEGHFLEGATAPEAKRTEEKPLTRFRGRVAIRELEHEIAVLDRIVLKLVDTEGNETLHQPSEPLLKAVDGRELLLGYGDEIELDFGLDETDWRGREASLIATGFYVPFSSPRLFATSATEQSVTRRGR